MEPCLICKAFEENLSCMWRAPSIHEFPSKNWEGYYAYSSRVGGKFCLLIDVRTLPLLRSGHKNPVVNIPCDLQRIGSW
jgi:hypothetical protein